MPIVIREQVFTASIGDDSPDQPDNSGEVQQIDIKTIVDLCTEKVLQKIKAIEER